MRVMIYNEDVGFVPVDEPKPWQKATIDWHPYPKEDPMENGLYLVTVLTGGESYVTWSTYDESTGWIHYTEGIGWVTFGKSMGKVLAWAHMPNAYEEEE